MVYLSLIHILLPAALAPDESYDNFGVFSGGAVEADGKQYLMYTGVVETVLPDGTKQVRQNQCLAVGDGINYEDVYKRQTLKEARANAYQATEWVEFDNKYMRHDIGKAIDEA